MDDDYYLSDAAKLERESLPKTFEEVALHWMDVNCRAWNDKTIQRQSRYLKQEIIPTIGGINIADVRKEDVQAIVGAVIDHRPSVADNIRMICGQVFKHAISLDLIDSNPIHSLRGTTSTSPKQHPTITDPEKIGHLMRQIDFCITDMHPRTHGCLLFAAYLFPRPIDLRFARWDNIDMDSLTWRIPAKGSCVQCHIVPLSKQAVYILNFMEQFADGSFVFPPTSPPYRSNAEVISESTINHALKRLGFSKDEMCAYGFHAMPLPILRGMDWSDEVIDAQMGRGCDPEHLLPERADMMQAWADHLDHLRGAKLWELCSTSPAMQED